MTRRVDGLAKRVAVSNDVADRRLAVRLQQAFEGGGDDGHGVQWDVVPVDLLQVGPRPATILGWSGAFAARVDGIETTWIEGHVTRVVHGVGTAETRTVVCVAVDAEVMQIHVALGEDDLSWHGGWPGHVAADEEARRQISELTPCTTIRN